MVLRVVFTKLAFRWLQTSLFDLKNYTIEILFMVDFYVFLKMLHFPKFFKTFEFTVASGKIVKCT